MHGKFLISKLESPLRAIKQLSFSHVWQVEKLKAEQVVAEVGVGVEDAVVESQRGQVKG